MLLLKTSFLCMTRIITNILFVLSITSYAVINKGPSRPAEYTAEG